MRLKIRFFFLLFILNTSGFKLLAQQTIICRTPISNLNFQSRYNEINIQPNDALKLKQARNLAQNNCLTSLQVKQVAGLFLNDFERLEFTKAAYINTFDRANFYDVYDAFATMSSAFRLHDYIMEIQGQANSNPNNPIPPVTGNLPTFPSYNYPNINTYSGKTGCNLPLAENDFNFHVLQVAAQKTESEKLASATSMAQSNCLSTAQVMKLSSLLQLESNRLNFAKNAFSKTYDIQNYHSVSQVFSHTPNSNELKAFVNAQLSSSGNSGNSNFCVINNDEFSQILQSVRNERINSTQVTVGKQIIKSKRCFTSLQVKEIVKLYGFESSRLEMAKYAYDYTTDKENFFVVNDAFDYDSSKKSMDEFIRNKK